MCRGKELFCNTSYAQLRLNCWELMRTRCRVHNIYIHEKFLAPTGLADVQDRVGIAKLTPVQPGDIGVTPMKAHKLNKVIEIFPDTLGPEYRRTRASANKEGNAAEKASGEGTNSVLSLRRPRNSTGRQSCRSTWVNAMLP